MPFSYDLHVGRTIEKQAYRESKFVCRNSSLCTYDVCTMLLTSEAPANLFNNNCNLIKIDPKCSGYGRLSSVGILRGTINRHLIVSIRNGHRTHRLQIKMRMSR